MGQETLALVEQRSSGKGLGAEESKNGFLRLVF
jgi:hypothetical protein